MNWKTTEARGVLDKARSHSENACNGDPYDIMPDEKTHPAAETLNPEDSKANDEVIDKILSTFFGSVLRKSPRKHLTHGIARGKKKGES